MKFLLVIPAFLLFLSNIPFVHEMDRKEMMAAMTEEGCCKKSESMKGSCESAEKSCSAPAEEKSCSSEEEKQCGMQTESTCICICCFQVAAPDQLGSKLQFGINDSPQSLAFYQQKNWKDPQLALPWQPPDVLTS